MELHPAVVEAHHAAVPMIAVTADRPPELRGIGSPQTIDQHDLYGRSVRLALDVEPASKADRSRWRSWASRTILAATGDPPGPVHCNIAFREPLLGEAHVLPEGRSGGAPWPGSFAPPPQPDLGELIDLIGRVRAGVLVAGRGCGGSAAVADLGDRLGWPVLADPLSGLRDGRDGVVAAFDALLRSGRFASSSAPEVVVQFGAAPASKVLQQWLDEHETLRAVVGIGPELPVPGHGAEVAVRADPDAVAASLVAAIEPAGRGDSVERWGEADRAAQRVLDDLFDGDLSEPAVARAVTRAAPEGAALVVSSSMPVRDIEWYGPHRSGVTVLANRGANGIDGVVSTAVGVASTGRPTVALLGDLAFLHDDNGLLGAASRGIDLTLVVVDNDGGGIFSFLPQAEQLAPSVFERAFGTPHGLDLGLVAEALGARSRRVSTVPELSEAVGSPTGVEVVVVESDRVTNVAVHDDLNAAVAAVTERL